MGMPSGPTVLPFKSEKLSFSLSYKSGAAPNAQVELACLCFDREGQVLDFIQFNRRAALNSALKHSSCSYLPPQDAVPADEALHMYPFEFAPQCEVMLLLASAPKNPFRRNDLGASSKLQFKVHAREMGKEQLQLLDVDLSLFVGHAAAKGAGPLSNGHQTMVIAGVYTNPQGWTLSFDCTTFAEDSWGLLLPQLRSLLQRWPSLSAADNGRKLPPQTVICSRKGEDQSLLELAAQLWPAGAGANGAGSTNAAGGDAAQAGSELCEGSSSTPAAEGEGRDTVPAAAADAAPAAAAGQAVSVDKVVLQLGWEVFRPRPSEDGEDEEPPAVDFALTLYNLQGEELATITADNTEVEGILVDEEEAEEPEEEVQAAQQEDQQAAAPENDVKEAGSDDADGEDGEEDEQVPLDEEDEETKAAKAAAAAEAAAAAAQAAAANQRPLAERFPLKRKVHINLPELLPDTRALLLTLSNFDGSGFKNVKSLQARLVLEEPQRQQEQQQHEDGAVEEDEEVPKPKKKGPKQPARVLAHYRFDSVQGADANLSQALLLKLYKEYPDSAFAVWQQQAVPDVAALLGGAAAAAAAVGGEDAAAGSSEKAKEVLQQVLATRKQLERDLAEARAKAEEEGLDDEEEGEPDLRLARGVWRVRVLGLTAGGSGPEDLADTVNNLLAYDGDLDSSGLRSSSAAKVAYPNRDTYFGGYAADAKAGLGLYVFANGGAYLGQYQAGKRAGHGLMVLPDGGLYRGGFVADKFEGQGTYLYPDNSYYTGSWKAGKKHGQGTYWDTAAGCLRGAWVAGALKGQGQYDQPNYHFEGTFAKGVPAGPCSFTLSAFRLVDLPQPAASYINAPHGPTLCGDGQYAVPPGAADEPEVSGDDEGAEAAEPDPDKPPMPDWPKYEGLKYESGASLPCSKPDVPFPPPAAPVAAI